MLLTLSRPTSSCSSNLNNRFSFSISASAERLPENKNMLAQRWSKKSSKTISAKSFSFFEWRERGATTFFQQTFSQTTIFQRSYAGSNSMQEGPRWWSSGQRPCLLLQRSEFESCWLLNLCEKTNIIEKEATVGPSFPT